MNTPEPTPPTQNVSQTATAGNDSLQAGGNNYISTTSKTNNLYISLFIIGIMALGGVSLAISLWGNSSQDGTSPQSNPPAEVAE